jgi:integrase-like protein
VRHEFHKVVEAAGLVPGEWTPRELRHSFVSLLSDAGMPIEQIARLVGHTSTADTGTVYRMQQRPALSGRSITACATGGWFRPVPAHPAGRNRVTSLATSCLAAITMTSAIQA